MLGCLKPIGCLIQSIITTVILFCFFTFGGLDYVKNFIDNMYAEQQSNTYKEAQKVADFSRISRDYKIAKTINIPGAKAVIAENKKNSQKLAFIDGGSFLTLSKNDIKSNQIDTKLRELSGKLSNKPVKLKELKVIRKGSFKALNQNIPYVKVKASFTIDKTIFTKEFEGIIGVIDNPKKGKSYIIASINNPDEYKQDITENFFKTVNFITKDKDNTHLTDGFIQNIIDLLFKNTQNNK